VNKYHEMKTAEAAENCELTQHRNRVNGEFVKGTFILRVLSVLCGFLL